MRYQELVARTLAVRHACLEMGLSRAREQQAFIEHAARLLDKTSWDYSVRMDKDFRVTFNIELGTVGFDHQYQAVKQMLATVFDVDGNAGGLDVDCRRSGCGCRVIFGDIPQ